MKKLKQFFTEFKAFISKGNILDLSIAVIIGGAFSAIVTALTNKIIMPLINLLLSAGGKNGLESAYTILKPVYDANGVLDLSKSIYIDWGAFITAVIDFLLIALVIFIMLKVVMASHKKLQELTEVVTKEAKKEVIKEKLAIKKQAKIEGRKFKEVWAEHEAEKQRQAEEKARILKEEADKKAMEDRINNPTQEDLLKEIRDLLKEQKRK